MRVVVLGGSGVFGARLGRLLARDGHDVWLAGRREERLVAVATEIGAKTLKVDLRTSPEAAFAPRPDVVVDASGPFQAYGDERYRLARLAIDNGVDYLDLADDPAFVEGISALDGAARAAGVRVLSGASSVPGLSSAAVRALGDGLDPMLLIDVAILPGNRAPRGRAVIESILGQIGRDARVWRGGAWRLQAGWSDPHVYRLAQGLKRRGYFLAVPDVRLFPAFFSARSVLFRAGLELPIMNRGLVLLARARRRWRLAIPPAGVTAIRWCAAQLERFGVDRGGMVVAVTGLSDGAPVRRVWRLIAEAGDGPYVPTIVVRALLRRLDAVALGARPCLAELPLADFENAMSDLQVAFATEETPAPTLFQTALGETWRALPAELRALHDVHDMEVYSGTGSVERGRSLGARLIGWLFRFPPPGQHQAVTVTKVRDDAGETWRRDFAGRVFGSRLTAAGAPARVRERFGPVAFDLDLSVQSGALRFTVRRGWLFRLPIPRFLLPRCDAVEHVASGAFHFDVALSAPLGLGLIVRYRGTLAPLI